MDGSLSHAYEVIFWMLISCYLERSYSLKIRKGSFEGGLRLSKQMILMRKNYPRM
jgi:hypothetical protein